MKKVLYQVLKTLQIDRLFRHINKERVLILAYHGISKTKYRIQPWIQIPVEKFEQQIKFISENYSVIALQDAANALASGKTLPANAAVITFDDGYRNNIDVAFPILKKYGIPATIFITAGYVGTNKILPMDEAFLIIAYAQNKKPLTLEEIHLGPLYFDSDAALLASYHKTVAALKKLPTDRQKEYLDILKKTLSSEYDEGTISEDFVLLSWDEIAMLLRSGLIQVGAHTVSHEILTNLEPHDAFREIQGSKTILQINTGTTIDLFAYPNGTVNDYAEDHIAYLRNNGFRCAVTTISKLNDANCDLYQLGRMSVGPELSESLSLFALRTAGVNAAFNKIRQ